MDKLINLRSANAHGVTNGNPISTVAGLNPGATLPAKANQPRGTIVHLMCELGGGVWSIARTLAERHRARWRVVLVGVHKGQLKSSRLDEAKAVFDDTLLIRRPSFPGSYYVPPLSVRGVLNRLQLTAAAGPLILHFHTGPATPWIFGLSSSPSKSVNLVSFHGSHGSFGDLGRPLKLAMHRRGVRCLLQRGAVLTAVSQRSAEDCAALYRCPSESFHVIYNGVDYAGRPLAESESPDSRSTWAL